MQIARCSALVVSALALLVLTIPSMVDAQTVNKCLAGKKKCVSKNVKALLGCHEKADKKGEPITAPKVAACLQKAKDKFDGGADPVKGCLAKLEAKENPAKPETICVTTDDTAAIAADVDAFVNQVAGDLDPAFVPEPRFVDTGLTIIDHLTGLEWEKKTDDGSVHDKDNTYTFTATSGGAEPDGTAFTVFLRELNDCGSSDGSTIVGGFAGHCDWRLARIDELQTILDPTQGVCGGGSGACVDPVFAEAVGDDSGSGTYLLPIDPPMRWEQSFISPTSTMNPLNVNSGYAAVRSAPAGGD